MEYRKIYNAAQLTKFVNEIGFLPLLRMGVDGWSAEEQVDEDCDYTKLPDGGWEWPLWKWKGSVIQESGCAYGKFFQSKAGFISREWWADFCNWRRSVYPKPAENSIEEIIIETLREQGSMVTRELRAACGFNGTKMRSKFDAFITRLQMACYIVTEDFIYPVDKHGKEYGWGWSLLTTPEQLFGKEAYAPNCTPEESYERMRAYFQRLFPEADDSFFKAILK